MLQTTTKAGIWMLVATVLGTGSACGTIDETSPANYFREQGNETEEFVANATLEELDEARFLIHGIKDVEAIAVNANYLLDQRLVQLDQLAERLDSAGLFEDLIDIKELRDLVDLLGSYPIEDFIPESTGQIDESGWPSTSTDFGGGPEGDLYPSFPSPDSLAGSGWTHVDTDENGDEYWEYDHTDENGTHTHKEQVVRGQDAIQTTWQVTNPDGSGVRSNSWLTEDGGTHTVNEKFDSNGEVLAREHIYEAPGSETPQKTGEGGKKIDQYQPADGETQGTLCPLVFWQCREAAKKLIEEGGDPYRLISGFALFNPGPEQENGEVDGPRLVFDPQTLVINPEAVKKQGDTPPQAVRLELPVAVLPPKPNN